MGITKKQESETLENIPEGWIKTSEASKIAGCSVYAIRQKAEKAELTCRKVRIGQRTILIYPRSEIEQSEFREYKKIPIVDSVPRGFTPFSETGFVYSNHINYLFAKGEVDAVRLRGVKRDDGLYADLRDYRYEQKMLSHGEAARKLGVHGGLIRILVEREMLEGTGRRVTEASVDAYSDIIDYVTAPEAARIIGFDESNRTMANYLFSEGELDGFKNGKFLYIFKKSIDDFKRRSGLL